MPRKKNAAPQSAGSDKDKALETALDNIQKNFGSGSIMRLGDTTDLAIDHIPTTSIALDNALGIGGIPKGRIIEIYGPESSGKTTLALHLIASVQAAGGKAMFVDAEHAMDPEYAKKLKEMEILLLEQMRGHDDPYRLWNQPNEGLVKNK